MRYSASSSNLGHCLQETVSEGPQIVRARILKPQGKQRNKEECTSQYRLLSACNRGARLGRLFFGSLSGCARSDAEFLLDRAEALEYFVETQCHVANGIGLGEHRCRQARFME